MAARRQELLELLELPRYPTWHYHRYGIDAHLWLGKKADAVQYVEALRGWNQPDSDSHLFILPICIRGNILAPNFRAVCVQFQCRKVDIERQRRTI